MAARKTPSKGGKPDKLMRDAIIIALHRTATDGKVKKLNLIADKLVDLAVAGDMGAIREVNDRVDGKAVQIVAGDENQPLDFLGGLGASIDAKLDRLIAGRTPKAEG